MRLRAVRGRGWGSEAGAARPGEGGDDLGCASMGSGGKTDHEAKAKLVEYALRQGATVRFFDAGNGRTGGSLSWGGGYKATHYGTTRHVIDELLRELGCDARPA